LTRERTGTAEGTGGNGGGDPRTAELDRIDAKLERLATQRKALRRALEQFGGDFDARTWTAAFESPDPDDINRVFTVTGGYLALVNNTAEAIRAGAKLAGLKPMPDTPGLPGVVAALCADGGITNTQAATFTELCRTRNRLQHSSPDIEADELHRQVRLLLRHLPGLIKSYVAWLEAHDVTP
jgi:hypothetical protein